MSSVDEQLAEVVGVAERQALAAGLSEHTLHELSLVLLGCEDPLVRGSIVTEVLATVGEYGDRAMVVALARVSYSQDEADAEDGPGGFS
jgi:hypothetical protein